MAGFSQVSLNRMAGLHPDLRRVLDRAVLGLDFMIIEGVRTREQCLINWGKGRTVTDCRARGVPDHYANPRAAKVTWLAHPLSSNHLPKADGLGHAVDCGPLPLNWNDAAAFHRLAEVILAAAAAEKVALVWGGTWKQKDLPHFELA
jgi:peptidoglycan L-alanyl-D-glutamate endopeptidase CwlK